MAQKSDTARKRGLAAADPQTRQRVAQTGGQAISRNRQHMVDIGRKGGIAAQRSGNAHQLTDKERSAGGKVAHQRGTTEVLSTEEAIEAGSTRKTR